jgi:Tol biopolymer transport system component/tRNA A-37 threonylcarbamoyl transferase component Bud32
LSDIIERLQAALADRYRVGREIGQGGMAQVFLAHDVKLDRRVALKVLRPDIAAALGSERFLREIGLAAKLDHPHVLPIHDSGEAAGLLYYVMPFVEGESLRDRLRREKQLPLDDALGICREVADALSHAHGHGVIHRDIKPENILIRSGHAVVADFGIARAVGAAGGERLTETGMTLGTPAYMSPEQATATRDLDGRSDLYSLGCVLYEMLAGEVPYGGPTPMAVVAKKLSEPLPRVSVVREAVPPAVEAALTKALAKAPADRFRTVEEFVAALDAAPSRFAMPRQSMRLPVVAVAGVVLLGATAFTVWKATRPFTVTASNPRQVTFDPGREGAPAISPDGSEVAYTVAGGLYVQSVEGGMPLRIAEQAGGAAWSADAERIIFGHADSGGTSGWYEVGRLGGPVRLLERHKAYNATLAPDRLHYVGFEQWLADTIPVYTYAIGGGADTRQLFARLEGWTGSPLGPWGFAWSPDGRRLAYGDNTGSPTDENSTSAIWVILEAGTVPIRVTDDTHRNSSPEWMPDNRHLLFVSDRDGPRDVYLLDAEDPGEPRRVTFGGQDPRGLSLSADGRRLAFNRFRFRRNIWAVPIPAEGTASIREGRAITSAGWSQLATDHDLSPDGDTLVYSFRADPRGAFHIFKMAVGGGTPTALTSDSSDDYVPVWSPDGREIAFGRWRRPDVDEAWVMDADGGNPRRVMTTRDYPAFCDWSDDALALICGRGRAGVWAVSRDSTRRDFAMSVDFGEPAQWSDAPCSFIRRVKRGRGMVCNAYDSARSRITPFRDLLWLSPDGKIERRFGATPFQEASANWLAYIQGKVAKPDPSLIWWVRHPRYAPDGRTLYFFGNPGGAVFVMSMPAEGGPLRKVVTFDDPSVIPWIPGPDGKIANGALSVGREELYLSIGEAESDIWVVDLEW